MATALEIEPSSIVTQTRSLRIAMLYELFWPCRGGVESWIASVSRELVKRGHEVTILTGAIPDQPAEEILEGLTVRRLDWRGLVSSQYVSGYNNIKRQLAWLAAAGGYLRQHHQEFDVIHPHVQASLVAALLGVPSRKIVWTWHGTYHRQLYEMFPLTQALFYEVAEHLSIHLPYAACITADQYTKDLAVGHMRARGSRIVPIANGVDVEMFQPKPVEKPENWPPGFHIVSTRRQVTKTGLQYLIPALRPIVDQRADVHLMLYGDGPLRPELERITKEQRLESNVHFMGPMPFSMMPAVYNASDMVAIPSLIEATSLACLEAMACGKLLLTCPVGGIPEIAPKELVLYAKPSDSASLTKCLQHAILEMSEEERRELGQRAREHVVNNFTWRCAVDKIERTYSSSVKPK